MKRTLSVNGFDTEVFFRDRAVEEILRPLLRCLTQKYEEEGRRQIAFMAGPPAAGKSTLALFLQELSREEGFAPVQALGMDGFHYPNAYLDTHTVKRGEEEILLRRIKGSPETYNTPDMEAALRRIQNDFISGKPCGVRWPSYDRNLHDVVPDTYPITGAILLIDRGDRIRLNKKALGCIGGYGALCNIANYLLLIGLDKIPASAQYPMVTGGVMIISTVICFFTDQKPTKKNVASVALSFAGILALVLLPG